MEHESHPCHQCNAEVEEGAPFCRKCGAPQIRVSREGTPEQPRGAPGSGDGSVSPVTGGVKQGGRSSSIDRRLARQQAALAGLLLAFILAAMFVFLPSLLLIPLASMLTIRLYFRKRPLDRISAGTGAGMGLLTGFFGFFMFALPGVPTLLRLLVYHPDPQLMHQLRAQFEAAARSNPNPQAQQMVQYLLTPAGLTFVVVALFVFLLVFTLVLSALGGAIGAALFKRSDKQT